MLIDLHTHLFPEAIAGRTLEKLAKISQFTYHTDGTAAGNLKAAADWKVDYQVVLQIATKPGQQHTINQYALQLQQTHPKLLCFDSVHPLDPQALEELDWIKQSGLYGVKLHPAYQSVHVGDPVCFPLYERMEQLGLPVLIHAGIDPLVAENFAPASELAQVAAAFPQLVIIAAHMGAMRDPADAKLLLPYENIYFDTAMSSIVLAKEDYFQLIRQKGADHILFGTDCPWNTAPAEKAYLLELGLTKQELSLIFWKNACRILGLLPDTHLSSEDF